jgi:predicted nucleic acid-binding protein
MNVVDSSCWIEYLMDSPIGKNVASVIETPGELVVPTITLYEVYKKLVNEKDEEYALDVVQYMQTGRVIVLDANLSVFAAKTSKTHGLSMADSIIYAAALRYGAELWTSDKHFKDIPGVHYLSKTASQT